MNHLDLINALLLEWSRIKSLSEFLDQAFSILQAPLSLSRLTVFRDGEILANSENPGLPAASTARPVCAPPPEDAAFWEAKTPSLSKQPDQAPTVYLPFSIHEGVWGCLRGEGASPQNSWSEKDIQLFSALSTLISMHVDLEPNRRKLDALQIQALSRQLVFIQENERRTIARELHDEATQSLSSLLVRMKLLEMNIHDPESTLEQIKELRKMTAQIMNNLHRLAVDLRPPALDHLGIVAALEQLIEQINREKQFDLQFEVVGPVRQDIDPQIKTAIYRIAQEALMNIRRHAQATQADIILESRQNRLMLVIEDNGAGFDPTAAFQSGRLGLIGMRERAESLGGSLYIESQPTQGTTIFAEIPYEINPGTC